VEYTKEKDIYKIQFPGMDMKNSTIYPLNAVALLSAVVLFCQDRDDMTGDCQSYFRQADALKQSLGK
jgi:hypothetical protein